MFFVKRQPNCWLLFSVFTKWKQRDKSKFIWITVTIFLTSKCLSSFKKWKKVKEKCCFTDHLKCILDVTNYSIIGKGYGNNIKKRKIAEALLIKEIKPTLNRQDQSIALRLFN